jgi:hypothetical protein
MYDIDLAENSTNQNLEIIYNNNQVFYKTIKRIYKDDLLKAFPSKDLEISLGLQFIQINSGKVILLRYPLKLISFKFINFKENIYTCKKCSKNFNFQYHLMLHSRYFCTFNTNNLLKILSGVNNEGRITNTNNNEMNETSVPNFNKSLKMKRKSSDVILNETSKRKSLQTTAHLTPNQNTSNLMLNEQENVYTNYFRKLISSLTENDSNRVTNQLKQLFNSNQLSTIYQYPFNNKIQEAYSSNDMTNLLNLMKSNNNMANFYQNIASNYQQNLAQFQQQQHQNGNFSNMILTYLDMRSKLLNETFIDSNNSPHQSEPSSPCLLIPGAHNQNLVQQQQQQQQQFQHQFKTISPIQNPIKSDHHEIINKETIDLKQSANQTESKITDFQSIQNWCAKCNTHFRLTSDLVYHMRTFHRKEDPAFTNSKLSKLTIDLNKKPTLSTHMEPTADDKFNNKRDLSKYLRCEICNELFKEKHHLRRHLTSHR